MKRGMAMWVVGAVLLVVLSGCKTAEKETKKKDSTPAVARESVDTGRGIPAFARYDRNSVRPPDGPLLLRGERRGLPAFHPYEKEAAPVPSDFGHVEGP